MLGALIEALTVVRTVAFSGSAGVEFSPVDDMVSVRDGKCRRLVRGER